MIQLTSEQKTAVDFKGDLLLSACPGSGKTRVILAKLLRLAEGVINTPKYIGCITYTNAAVDEIEYRLRKYGSNECSNKCEVATIHSFCLQFILKPYHWLIPEIPNNFHILTGDMEDFTRIVKVVEDEAGRRPSRYIFDDYQSIRMDLNGNPSGSGFVSGSVTELGARRYWELVRRKGYLDFAMVMYYSWRIVDQFDFVGRGLASRFESLLVDEFQDTTDIQIEIFRALKRHLHTDFFLVGDENQSILGFAGARPDLAQSFAQDIGAELSLKLSGNFRSAPAIVSSAETLIPTNPAMRSDGEASHILAAPQYVHVNNPIDAITDHFLPILANEGIALGDAAVLAPWWTHLIPVARALREFDVPVFGPGARPYKRKRLFAVLAEQLGACAVDNNLLGLPGVEKALFRLIGDVTGSTRFDVFSYAGRKTALSMVYSAKQYAEENIGGERWLIQTSNKVAQILVNDEWLPNSAQHLLTDSVQEMFNDMNASRIDISNLLISDLGLFANPDKALKLITLHNSKGREFQAVAIICANQGSIPHFLSRTSAEILEARRLFYVGLTRAKKTLLVASDMRDQRNPPSQFIREAGF